MNTNFPGKGLVRCLSAVAVVSTALGSVCAAEVTFTSPGLSASRMDEQARLLEDWGAVAIKISAGDASSSQPKVERVNLDSVIPAAQAKWEVGAVAVTVTCFRAPAWPAGLDVLTVTLKERTGQDGLAQVLVELPDTGRIGSRTVSLGGRTVMALPSAAQAAQESRPWGWYDDGVTLAGWARPAVPCDPAFKNIRAGLGGVPLLYRFKVEPKAAAAVVLGFCESHWADAGQRPLVCTVEGAAPQEVDPLAAWGQHKPGALEFAARDQNGDGQIEVAVAGKPGAPDENPILNAIWIFPGKTKLGLDEVIAGKLNDSATYYVDVGGSNDQSLFAGGKLEYAMKLAPNGTRELTFLVACPGGSAPGPDRTAWTPAKLREAAREVWREWAER